MEEIYTRLAEHLENLIMGYPFSEALIDLLKETYTPVEAQVALAIPNHLLPLQVVDVETIIQKSELPKHAVLAALKSLSEKNIIYSSPTRESGEGYALLQVGYGMPQTFFWGGETGRTRPAYGKTGFEVFHRSHHTEGLWRCQNKNIQIQSCQSGH